MHIACVCIRVFIYLWLLRQRFDFIRFMMVILKWIFHSAHSVPFKCHTKTKMQIQKKNEKYMKTEENLSMNLSIDVDYWKQQAKNQNKLHSDIYIARSLNVDQKVDLGYRLNCGFCILEQIFAIFTNSHLNTF